jgi:hypothetical protein
MTDLPTGMAPVFFGWNVWTLYQTTKPDESVLAKIWHLGIAEDQMARLWVENQIEDNAPGANVSDPVNPDVEHLRGDEVQMLPGRPSLAIAAAREKAGFADPQHLGTDDAPGAPIERTVRFYNRGKATVMPWPHDKNFLVDVVYQPSASNVLTNGPAPKTAAEALSKAGDSLLVGLEIAGVGIGLLLILQLTRK